MFPTSLYKSNQSGTSTKIMMEQKTYNVPEKNLGHEYSNETFHIQSVDTIVTAGCIVRGLPSVKITKHEEEN